MLEYEVCYTLYCWHACDILTGDKKENSEEWILMGYVFTFCSNWLHIILTHAKTAFMYLVLWKIGEWENSETNIVKICLIAVSENMHN